MCERVCEREVRVRACVEVKVQSRAAWLGLACTCNCGGPAERERGKALEGNLGKVKRQPTQPTKYLPARDLRQPNATRTLDLGLNLNLTT